ncbi:hypothetical protein SAICODRAFT_97143 [Saitoella complicata NRRL Y-17804]|uniref:uncharacterized protein n=1 Tax=Saitoella complicata (strain BCRC 22490 / CBS 7301 / JCM 7358 / NBRC 10748 / NRRL Y-17804) TaxID=698492 RepID=UPI000866EB4F|nr:uncharacterized protein SAICODRAFT_97143 [Saitoella complicata NRRL Y-17804]ODQ50368.1 hypothetical protein SAICODRAFT_97143 [Saitoella complicata NRRL Y-17804]
MPELAEVERARTFLHTHLASKRITSITAPDDAILYVSPTSATAFKDALENRIIGSVKRYGKYFWFEMEAQEISEGLCVLMHLGMTGWPHIRNTKTHYYSHRDASSTDIWPPKFWKFTLMMDDGTEMAFCDPRRLGRVRLVHTQDPMSDEPLSRLGFDPVICMPSLPLFSAKVRARRVPIKALLLDQAFSAGVGNWVADEVLYQAGIHPEQYSNTVDERQLERLWEWTRKVPVTAVEAGGDSDSFPEDWLFKHRWSKGKTGYMPSGEKITFITVGGRTSAVVSSRQKLIGTSDIDGTSKKVTKRGGTKRKKVKEESEDEEEEEENPKPVKEEKEVHEGMRRSGRKRKTVKKEDSLSPPPSDLE